MLVGFRMLRRFEKIPKHPLTVTYFIAMFMRRIKMRKMFAETRLGLQLVYALSSCAYALIAQTSMVNTSSCYFIGASYQYSARIGHYDFDELQKSELSTGAGQSIRRDVRQTFGARNASRIQMRFRH